MTKRDGSKSKLSIEQIRKQTIPACDNLPGTSADELELEAQIVFTDGISTQDIQKALVNAASSKIDIDKPNWTYVAARLTLYDLYHKVKRTYDRVGSDNVYDTIWLDNYLIDNENILDFDKSIFDLNKLENTIKPERDLLFNYIGISTLISRYLIKQNDNITELPQHMFMGLAMWLAQNEDNPTERAIEFYDAMSQLKIVLSTPILSKGRRKGATHISCFVDSVEDSLQGILDHYSSFSFGSKNGGGFGCDWTRVRALGGTIQGQSNAAGGIVPWLKLQNDFSNAVDQLGTRKGSENASIENWHLDVFDFIDLKKTSGEERRRAEDLFLSLSVSDLFMKRVTRDSMWTLFDPYDVPNLTELHGEEFTAAYEFYEDKLLVDLDDGSHFKFTNPPKQIKAKELWAKMISSYFTRGAPYIFFKDTVNRTHNHPENGIVRSSNLCVTGDTKVLTKEYGYIPIQNVAGKTLECWNGSEWSWTPLYKTHPSYDEVYTVTFSNGEFINASDYHKWYVEQTPDNFCECVRTHELEVGDVVSRDNIVRTGKLTVRSIEKLKGSHPLYCGTEPKVNKLCFNGIITGNCMEILQPNNEDETSVCILGSLNLARIVNEDSYELSYYSKLLFRMLDNTIDLSNYPTEKSKLTELSRRAIGMGIMGEAEDIANKQIHYGSTEHIEYVHEVMGTIRTAIDEVNVELAKERGSAPIFSTDEHIRCAYQMAIAPTASISLIAGTTSAHEPVFGYKWNEDGLFGPTTLTAPNINPDNYQYYKSAYDIDQKKMLDVCAAHQQYVDQSISHNLYFRPEGLTAGKIADTIIYAWKIGVKTLYYLRSKSQKAQNDDSLSSTISCTGCQ